MKNAQSIQEPLEAQAPAPEIIESNSTSKTRKTSGISLIHLLAHYPWLFLGGVLAIFLSSAAVALYSLGYTGRIEPQEPEDTLAVQEFEVKSPASVYAQTAEASNNPLPLWIIAAIAASCATGCFIIFRFLNYPARQQKFQKNTKRYQSRLTQRQFPKLELPSAKNLPVFVPRSARKTFTMPDEERKPVVTVLPPEENFNKDNEESLASMMDIRKQTSLSALLRK